MKKYLKYILIVIGIISLFFIIDFIGYLSSGKPIFIIRKDVYNEYEVYRGIFFDCYNCPMYSMNQIKVKGNKYSCDLPK